MTSENHNYFASSPSILITNALRQWLETKKKCRLEAHEVLSEDPALYRWQCWASNFEDPNSKDPTFIEEPRFRDRTDNNSEVNHFMNDRLVG